jgi:large subunit ribosomal protein L32
MPVRASARRPNLSEEAMAVPKRRTSKSRKRLRRGHHSGAGMRTQACPRCSSPKLPHRVCPTCGYYRGKKLVEVKED